VSNEKSKFDEGYEAGFEAGKALRLEVIDLKARYLYLRLGGSWQVDSAHESTTGIYLAGFEDAMRTLEVKP